MNKNHANYKNKQYCKIKKQKKHENKKNKNIKMKKWDSSIVSDDSKKWTWNHQSMDSGPGSLHAARSHRERRNGARIIENRRVLTPFEMEWVNHVHSLNVALAKSRSRRTGNSPTTFKELRVCIYDNFSFISMIGYMKRSLLILNI